VRVTLLVVAVFVVAACFCATPRALAQNPDALMPDESEAKAKQVLQQLIDALGGQVYLQVRESDCTGRLSEFNRNSQTANAQFDYGYIGFHDLWKYPDRNRTEYELKGNRVAAFFAAGDMPTKRGKIIDIYAGDKGWVLDKGGVEEETASAIAQFQEQVKTDFDNLLRFRLKEDGLIFRYGGSDLVDLKMVDWVEIVDRYEVTYRAAVDRETHLPRRVFVIKRNEATRERTEEDNIFANFRVVDGVKMPMEITHEVDGRRTFEVFYNVCKLNTGLPDELFTKESLEQDYAKNGRRNKNDKNDKNDKSEQGALDK
jgi:hypothetical protein